MGSNDTTTLIGAALDGGGPRSGPYWHELRTFLAVAAFKSYSRAAEHLGTNHTTVGRQIRRLTDLFGGPLVVSSKAGSLLTERGREVVEILSRIDRTLFSLETDLKRGRDQISGLVRLSVSDGLGLLYVVPALESFSRTYPGVQIDIGPANLLKRLREDRADVMVGNYQPAGEDHASTLAGYYHLMTFASPAYLPLRATGLQDAPRVFVDSHRFRGPEDLWTPWRDYTSTGRTAHLCDSSLVYSFMVKAGLGIGLLPSYNLLEPSFTPVDSGVDIRIPIYVVALKERLAANHVDAVYRFVVDLLQDSVWLRPDQPNDLNGATLPAGHDLVFGLRPTRPAGTLRGQRDRGSS